jgi:hypothetical protein
VICRPKKKFGVGGILALPNYAVQEFTDCVFRGPDGVCLLSTEIKTVASFPTGHTYYHGSRLVQLLGALYAGGGKPSILLTRAHFKLAVESSDRRSILTYPDGYETMSLHDDFVNALVIVLLSALRIDCDEGSPPTTPPNAGVRIRPSGPYPPSAEKFVTGPSDLRRSSRLQGKASGPVSEASDADESPFQNIWLMDPDDVDDMSSID